MRNRGTSKEGDSYFLSLGVFGQNVFSDEGSHADNVVCVCVCFFGIGYLLLLRAFFLIRVPFIEHA